MHWRVRRLCLKKNVPDVSFFRLIIHTGQVLVVRGVRLLDASRVDGWFLGQVRICRGTATAHTPQRCESPTVGARGRRRTKRQNQKPWPGLLFVPRSALGFPSTLSLLVSLFYYNQGHFLLLFLGDVRRFILYGQLITPVEVFYPKWHEQIEGSFVFILLF